MSHSRADRQVGGTVELAHFWEEGDGRAMLDAVLDGFSTQHPNVQVTDQPYQMGEHGMMIKSRMLQQDSPDLFVEWPGQNLEPYYDAGAVRPITDLWETNGWIDAFVDGAIDRCRIEGDLVGVPVDIHRMNNLWYHVDLVDQYGVDPAGIGDPREFLEVLQQCHDLPVIGLEQPMKNPDDVLQVWSAIVIGLFGAEVFETITTGDPGRHRSELEEALALMDRYAEYARERSAFDDMVDANDRFLDGKSVFFYQGDWMAGVYGETDDFEYDRDWGRVNFPGTDGVYMLGIDAIVPSAWTEFDDDTRAFLEFVGSTDALESLNRMKGSIPPRRDISLDSYPQVLQEQYRDFKAAEHFPGGHALQVRPDVFVEARSAISTYLSTGDLDRTAEQLADAYRQ
jgi:glucose/mannose transport system substrate-binding protein